ncbi:MAG: glycosyltransferase family 2 protein [Erythrobacter sp.]
MTDTAPAISILIVAYNSRDFICDCIGSVIAHTAPGSYEILLVDNGTDATADLVAATFPSVRIIPGQGNIGFGRGNNLLAEHARGDYLLLLNPDTRLEDPAIDRLLAFARAQPGAAWGGLTKNPDGELHGNFLPIPTLGTILREVAGMGGALHHDALARQLGDGPRRIEVLTGGYMMVSREAWQALGGFDESFLLYSEEVDLFTRLKKLGGAVWLCPDSQVIHDVGSGDLFSPIRLVFAYTGRMHYARRHWRGLTVPLIGVGYWLSALRRWLTSMALGPVSATHRARRRAFTPIILRPWVWWRGYDGRTSLE